MEGLSHPDISDSSLTVSVPLRQKHYRKAPTKYQAGLSSELTEMFNCRTIGEAKKRDQILADYKDILSHHLSWMKDLRVHDCDGSARISGSGTSNHIEGSTGN